MKRIETEAGPCSVVVRNAVDGAFISTAYVRVGLSGDYGTSWLLTQLLGRDRASEPMPLAEKVDAQRCTSIGIFNRVVPDQGLQDEAFALARHLAHGPGLAQSLIKDNLDAATLAFPVALDREAERLFVRRWTPIMPRRRARFSKSEPSFGVK